MPTYDNLRENVGCTVVDTNRQSFLLEGADKECYIYIFQQFRQQLSNLKNSFRHQIPTYVSMLKLWFTKILDTYKCST
jgi:capsule polysaccharide modification protein KpsS